MVSLFFAGHVIDFHAFHTFRSGGWAIKGEVRSLKTITTLDCVESRRNSLQLHFKMFECPMCERTFARKDNLLRHVRNQHATLWTCVRCRATFNRQDNFSYHERTCEFRATGKRPATNQVGEGEPKRKRPTNARWHAQALDHVMEEFTVDLEQLEQTPETILDVLKDAILDLKATIEQELEKKRALKIISFVLPQFSHPLFSRTMGYCFENNGLLFWKQ